MTNDDLIEFFSVCGNIVYVNVAVDKEIGKFRGFAKVCFDTENAMRRVVEDYNGAEFDGCMLFVCVYNIGIDGKGKDKGKVARDHDDVGKGFAKGKVSTNNEDKSKSI